MVSSWPRVKRWQIALQDFLQDHDIRAEPAARRNRRATTAIKIFDAACAPNALDWPHLEMP